MNFKEMFKLKEKEVDINDHINNINRFVSEIINDEEFLKENPYAFMTFSKMIFYFMHKKYPNVKDSIIYKRAHIDAKLFNKIKDEKYHPSKKTAIALGLALNLDMDEFEALLTSAYYALSLNNLSDFIIMYCVYNKIYDLMIINEIFYEFNLPIIF